MTRNSACSYKFKSLLKGADVVGGTNVSVRAVSEIEWECNNLPKFDVFDQAMRDRIIVIPYNEPFKGDEAFSKVHRELIEERRALEQGGIRKYGPALMMLLIAKFSDCFLVNGVIDTLLSPNLLVDVSKDFGRKK